MSTYHDIEFILPATYPITLYLCPLSTALLDAQTASELQAWLSEDEVAKTQRYIKQDSREQGVMVRGYLRALLSLHADVHPSEWRFEYGDKGKPRLSQAQFDRTGLYFNLSHSGDWLLVGICKQPIDNEIDRRQALEFGVDIERCRTSTNIHAILSHYFSELEKEALLALPEAEQRQRFFDLWALKESYIKAKGLGLALSLKSFAFDFAPLVETSLKLKVIQSHRPTVNSGTHEVNMSQILIKQSIGLATQQDNDLEHAGIGQPLQQMKVEKNWHCMLGHVDEHYRFAISVGQCQAIVVEAMTVDLKVLVERTINI